MPIVADEKNLKTALGSLDLLKNSLSKLYSESEKKILVNLVSETQDIFVSVVFNNSIPFGKRTQPLLALQKKWKQLKKALMPETADQVFLAVDNVIYYVHGALYLLQGLALINEGKTGDDWVDIKRVVPGLKLISEAVEVFPDVFLDDIYEQLLRMCNEIAGRSPRSMEEYFEQSEEQIALVTQLRAYSSLIAFRSEKILNLRLKERSENDGDEIYDWLQSLPETEDHWLDRCPEAKASVERGLAQAAAGKVRRRSFTNMEFSD